MIHTNLEEEDEIQHALRETKSRFRTGPKNRRTCHLVIEVSPKTRNALLPKGRIYINYTSHTIKDFITVARCFKCGDLGHTSKHCNGNEVCTHCGDHGHRRENCSRKNEPKVCVPCKLRKKECKAEDYKECRTYLMMEERIINSTDYGK